MTTGADSATEAATDGTPGPPSGHGGGRSVIGRRVNVGRLLESTMLPIAFGLLVLGFGLREQYFLTASNFSNILGSQAVLFVLTMALLVPLTNNDIDLSVGAASGLVSMVVIVLNVQHGVGIGWCCLIGIAVGAAAGLVNGALILLFDANSFIITLGTGTVYAGLNEYLSKEQTITGVSDKLTNAVFIDQFLGVPLEFYYGLAIMLIIWYLLTFTPFGQRALFVGQSREVARLSGFRVSAVRLQGFLLAGVIAAVSGILFVGTTGSASPGDGNALLLPAFAAAFLGMTTIQPGRFNAIGAGIAVYFLATGVSGLALAGAGNYVQEVFYGVVLVLAVVVSRLLNRRRYGRETAGT